MLNCTTLIGRLCTDVELKTTNSGKSVATFRIAVDRAFVKQGEQRQADFITIVAWGNQALFVSRYFSKGSMIAIQGRIQTRNFEDGNGNKRTAFEVVATEISFCGGKNENSSTQNENSSTDTSTDKSTAPGYSTALPSDFEEIVDDDDLPF